jgi:hypothetical protein
VSGTPGPWARVDYGVRDAAANTVYRPAVSGFSIWTLGNADAPLPVELLAFTAEAQQAAVALKWRTASEKNNDRFEVERSRDGHDFGRIATVAGQGTKASPTNYALLDEQLPGETRTLYYRLRQVDTDGTASYSPVRVVTLTPRSAAFIVYPTVVEGGQLRYTYSGPALSDGTLEVYTLTGQRVAQQVGTVVGSGTLAVPGLTEGWYLVRLRTAAGAYTARFYQP